MQWSAQELEGHHFHLGYLAMAQELFSQIKHLLANSYEQIVVVGHSYGGSVAAILVHLIH